MTEQATRIGFVGGGRIVRILLAGWQRVGRPVDRVLVHEIDEGAIAVLERERPGLAMTRELTEEFHGCDVVFLALHPPALLTMLDRVRNVLSEDAVVVSLAPKTSLEVLTTGLGGFDHVARTIPNAPSWIGRGFNPTAFGPACDDARRRRVLAWLEPLGDAPVVEESTLETYAVLTAMGPTYFWPAIHELCRVARAHGLSDPEASWALERMLLGSMRMSFEAGLTQEALEDLIPVHPLKAEAREFAQTLGPRLTAVLAKLRS